MAKRLAMNRIRISRVLVGMFCVLAFAGLASLADANSGTKLSVVTEADPPVCSADNTTATVIVTAAVTSSGSTAAASVLVSTDGGVTFTNVATVAETDWLHNRRTKTAEVEIELTLTSNVPTQVTVCFMQPGANGNEFTKACSDLTITPACDTGGDPGGR